MRPLSTQIRKNDVDSIEMKQAIDTSTRYVDHAANLICRPTIVLTVLCALVVAQRLHTYREPPQQDVNNYAVLGHEMLRGRALYSDLWDNRPPATNVSYALAELVAGNGAGSMFLLSVVSALVTLIGVYAAGGLWAAVMWSIVWSDLWLRGNQPNTEVFLNACRVLAFWALLRATPDRDGDRKALLAGALLALATLYKQFLVVDVALLAAAHVAFRPVGVAGRRRAWRQAAIIVGACVVAWAALFAYFALTGRFAVFYEAMVTYNRFYAGFNPDRSGGLLANLRASFRPDRLWPTDALFVVPLAALALLGLVLAARRNRRAAALYVAWVVATHLDVALPGRFYLHYYQLWLPPLVVGAGWGLAQLARFDVRWAPRVSAALGVATLAVLGAREYRAYTLPAEQWATEKYGRQVVDYGAPARDIEALLQPEETFYLYGTELGLYRVTGRRPPSGVMYLTHIQWGPLARTLRGRVLADLEREQPALVVMPPHFLRRPPRHPVLRWCLERYRFLRMASGDQFALLVRRDGRLDQRGGHLTR